MKSKFPSHFALIKYFLQVVSPLILNCIRKVQQFTVAPFLAAALTRCFMLGITFVLRCVYPLSTCGGSRWGRQKKGRWNPLFLSIMEAASGGRSACWRGSIGPELLSILTFTHTCTKTYIALGIAWAMVSLMLENLLLFAEQKRRWDTKIQIFCMPNDKIHPREIRFSKVNAAYRRHVENHLPGAK